MCNFRIHLVSLLLFVLITGQLAGQTPFVKQVVIANSGKFEFAPPFEDVVTLQTTEPVSGTTHLIHTIGTQSAQDIVRKGKTIYVAAQDSLIMIDADTYQRVGGIPDSGLNKLLISGNKLIVSKQYPLKTNFTEVRNTIDLTLLAGISDIPGDCGNMVILGDSLYIAVNGGWMGTEGKIAVVDTATWTMRRIINLGSSAVGIMSMYVYRNRIFTVNKSPYSTPDAGSISEYNPSTGQFTNYVFAKNVATGAGIDGNHLYFIFNYGIASFNLDTRQIDDSTVVPDPGSSMFRYITSAIIDTLNHRIYANTGDFFTPGNCHVFSVSGDSITTWPTGISSDALLVDYRVSGTGLPENSTALQLTWNPNPVADNAVAMLPAGAIAQELSITNSNGIPAKPEIWNCNSGKVTIKAGNLKPGLYLIQVQSQNGKIFTGKIIKE